MEFYGIGRGYHTRLNLLIYGEAGMGKTTLAATAQEHEAMRDVLFANIEGGLLSVEELDYSAQIAAVDVNRAGALRDLYLRLVKREEDPELKRFNTLVIDSGSELARMNMDVVVGDAIAREAGQQSGAKHTSIDDVHVRDHGTNISQISRVFRMFRDLDMNLIITALDRETFPRGKNNENKPPIARGPDFGPALSRSVMAFVDFAWLVYKPGPDEDGNEQPGRRILTQPVGITKAKTRGKKFGELIGNPIVWDDPEQPLLAEIYDKLLSVGASRNGQQNGESQGDKTNE